MTIKALLESDYKNQYAFVMKDVIQDVGHLQAMAYETLVKECHKREAWGGWFQLTYKEMEEDNHLKERTLRRYISMLKEKGYIDSRIEGLPAMKYYKIM
ncbi:hypothetical protein [Geomicrobium sp. JCM 19055]|uniref:hypothetical protein n=1 Tax=Geomicrobium sp. JCM 19055 TaxID=1460649 RepID=UPI00045ED887|nr:hypothetical protein [Geomicrobium sp. JCM 19055]GAK00896.1 hypothetical protein JCM19055_4019 [Geomicrobium sp. JCM 19055]